MESMSDRLFLDDLRSLFKTHSSIPTHTPKKLIDCIYFYHDNASTYRIYVYLNNEWKYSNLSTGQTPTAVGSGTRAATTGEQSFTGFGFTPTLVIFKAWKGGASSSYTDESLASHSYGHAKSSSDDHCHTFYFRAGAIMAWINYNTDNLVNLIGIDGNADVVCDFVSMDEDGFTIDWTTANDSCNYMYEAFG